MASKIKPGATKPQNPGQAFLIRFNSLYSSSYYLQYDQNNTHYPFKPYFVHSNNTRTEKVTKSVLIPIL